MIHRLHHSEDLYSIFPHALIGSRPTFFSGQPTLPPVLEAAKMEFMIC
jgi:hypothetical protein